MELINNIYYLNENKSKSLFISKNDGCLGIEIIDFIFYFINSGTLFFKSIHICFHFVSIFSNSMFVIFSSDVGKIIAGNANFFFDVILFFYCWILNNIYFSHNCIFSCIKRNTLCTYIPIHDTNTIMSMPCNMYNQRNRKKTIFFDMLLFCHTLRIMIELVYYTRI